MHYVQGPIALKTYCCVDIRYFGRTIQAKSESLLYFRGVKWCWTAKWNAIKVVIAKHRQIFCVDPDAHFVITGELFTSSSFLQVCREVDIHGPHSSRFFFWETQRMYRMNQDATHSSRKWIEAEWLLHSTDSEGRMFADSCIGNLGYRWYKGHKKH